MKPYWERMVLVFVTFFIYDEFQCPLGCVKEKWLALQTRNTKDASTHTIYSMKNVASNQAFLALD